MLYTREKLGFATPANLSFRQPSKGGCLFFLTLELLMAKIVSHMHSSMKGSIGGVTYYNGPGNPILARTRAMPSNPNSPGQQKFRSAFSDGVYVWNMMGDVWRLQWAAYAATLGGGKTGRQVFMAMYSWAKGFILRGGTGLTLVTDPPTLTGLFNVTFEPAVANTAPSTGFSIPINNLDSESGVVMAVIQGPFNEARYYFKGPFPDSSCVFLAIPAMTVTKLVFTNLVENGVYFVKIRGCVDDIGLRLSSMSIIRAIATTTAA